MLDLSSVVTYFSKFQIGENFTDQSLIIQIVSVIHNKYQLNDITWVYFLWKFFHASKNHRIFWHNKEHVLIYLRINRS